MIDTPDQADDRAGDDRTGDCADDRADDRSVGLADVMARPWRLVGHEPDALEAHASWVVSEAMARPLCDKGGLRVGVVADIGPTMTALSRATTRLSWVLLRAAHDAQQHRSHIPDLPVSTAVCCAGAQPTPMTWIVSDEDRIPSLGTGSQRNVHAAIETVGHLARLAEPGAARLLVLICDAFGQPERFVGRARRELEVLRRSGCGVLWLCPSSKLCIGDDYPGTTLLFDPNARIAVGLLVEAIRIELERPDPDTEPDTGDPVNADDGGPDDGGPDDGGPDDAGPGARSPRDARQGADASGRGWRAAAVPLVTTQRADDPAGSAATEG
ncbi:hypothetical protein [Pseudonocardia sp. HH130630-07]|uniref:hypothetical protein n=1 Tax=Pseudonocardia sp. HH130630-07 TaxID=1690815 RepID=UPI000814D196|nr:hypothetical protein [Pseudonocardia sp. HH130630-07]ANY07806.1 hypothetical protein AFB00_17575 [Pseudonocardia sp. HH130630-07]